MPRGFESLADAIMARWASERDVWVAPSEIAQARAYLAAHGIPTRERSDGTFDIEGEAEANCDAARLVLLGLRRLHAVRRTPAGS